MHFDSDTCNYTSSVHAQEGQVVCLTVHICLLKLYVIGRPSKVPRLWYMYMYIRQT